MSRCYVVASHSGRMVILSHVPVGMAEEEVLFEARDFEEALGWVEAKERQARKRLSIAWGVLFGLVFALVLWLSGPS